MKHASAILIAATNVAATFLVLKRFADRIQSRELEALRRQQTLVDVEDTRRSLLSEWAMLMDRVNGDPDAIDGLQMLRATYPHAALGPIGDPDTLTAFYDAEGELLALPAGVGLTHEDYDRLWQIWQDALANLDQQMERVFQGDAPEPLDAQVVANLRAEALARNRPVIEAARAEAVHDLLESSDFVAVQQGPNRVRFASDESTADMGQLPAEYEWVELDRHEAADFLELGMIAFDLEFAASLLSRQVEVLQDVRRPLPRPLVDDLRSRWNAAVVAYARPFMSGSRLRLGSTIFDEHGPRLAESHARFMAIRNRHVAHSVSELEIARVAVAFNPGDYMSVREVVPFVASALFGTREQTLELLQLATIAKQAVSARMADEHRRVREYAAERSQELSSRPRVTTLWSERASNDLMSPRRTFRSVPRA